GGAREGRRRPGPGAARQRRHGERAPRAGEADRGQLAARVQRLEAAQIDGSAVEERLAGVESLCERVESVLREASAVSASGSEVAAVSESISQLDTRLASVEQQIAALPAAAPGGGAQPAARGQEGSDGSSFFVASYMDEDARGGPPGGAGRAPGGAGPARGTCARGGPRLAAARPRRRRRRRRRR
ncbi:unnamed protein product, partial [Prorocentrum cordatum]